MAGALETHEVDMIMRRRRIAVLALTAAFALSPADACCADSLRTRKEAR
jgi:hypothetical protein